MSPTTPLSAEAILTLLDGFSGLLIWHLDPNFTFRLLRGGGTDLLGLRQTERPFLLFDLVGTRDPQATPIAQHLQALAGVPASYDYDYNDRSYQVKLEPVIVDGSVTGVTGLAVDVTERIRSERKAQQTLAEQKAIFDNIPDIIWLKDTQSRFIAVNGALADAAGMPAETMTGMTDCDLWPAELAAQYIADDQAIMEGGVQLRLTERLVTSSGERWIETIKSPVYSGGTLVGTAGVARDVTERYAVEKMKNELISIISHELRTPLTSIHGAIRLLTAGRIGELPPRAQNVLTIAARNTERLVRLINDILNMERIESGHLALAPVDCTAAGVVAEAVEAVTPLAEAASISIVTRVDDLPFRADTHRIVQTLTNLLSNAIKFSPPRTTVTVEVSAEAGAVRFAVIDQGRGIPADKLELVFDRFRQLDASDAREKDGSGLGLAICRGIVREHGGTIWAESSLGEGSRFVFTLPLCHAAVA